MSKPENKEEDDREVINLGSEPTIAYKGFQAKKVEGKLKCEDMLYEKDLWYQLEIEPHVCNWGFHACTCPSSVLKFYPPNQSRYGRVELKGTGSVETGMPVKLAADNIKVTKEYSLREYVQLVQEHIQAVDYKNPCWCGSTSFGRPEVAYGTSMWFTQVTESESIAWSSYQFSVAATFGEYSIAVTEKPSSVAMCRDNKSRAVALDYRSVAAAVDGWSVAEARGNSSVAVTTHECSRATGSGKHSIAAAMDVHSLAEVRNARSVAFCAERSGYVKVAANSVGVIFAYREYNVKQGEDENDKAYNCPHFRVDKGGRIVICFYEQTGMGESPYSEYADWQLVDCKVYEAGKDFDPNWWYEYSRGGLRLDLVHADHVPCFHHSDIPITDKDLQHENRGKK
jgi:hypothetical protein